MRYFVVTKKRFPLFSLHVCDIFDVISFRGNCSNLSTTELPLARLVFVTWSILLLLFSFLVLLLGLVCVLNRVALEDVFFL